MAAVTRVRHAAARHRQLAVHAAHRGDRQGDVFTFRTLDDTRALLERAGPRREGGRDRRRAARPRGRARPAGPGLRRHGGAPDADADGAAARRRRRQLPGRRRWRTSAFACCSAERRRRSSATSTRGRRGVRGRHHPRRGSGGGRRGIRPERGARAQGRPPGQPRHRRQRPHGDLASGHLRRRRVRGASTASATASWRRCSNRAKVLAATITGNKGPVYTGSVQAAKLKIMGVDVFSAGDWSEQNAEPVRYEDRALGVYKKLTLRDGKLVGRHPGRRHLRQPSLHGLAAHGHRPDRPAPAPAVPAAGLRCGLDIARDGRQRHRLRLRRRDQRRHHRAPSTTRASTRSRSSRRPRAPAPAAAAAPPSARRFSRPSRRSSRKRPRR